MVLKWQETKIKPEDTEINRHYWINNDLYT